MLPLIVSTLLHLNHTSGSAETAEVLLPIPDRTVVLTFDDSVKSHFTVVKPILEKHGFGATEGGTLAPCQPW